MKKILVVDDEDDFLFIVKKVLSYYSDKFEVIPVNSSQKCLDYLKKNIKPDLILLDIMLPQINGFELYERIKHNECWKNIPILFTSAWSEVRDKFQENRLGEGYIEKPFEAKYLISLINNILDTR